jgi:S-adenosylmethionine-dependent methyltransferase
MRVTLLDSSPAMLDIAKRTAQEAGVTDKIVLQHGDAAQLANLFHTASFDVILCHNVLEYLDDPIAVLCGAARALRNSSAILSPCAEPGWRRIQGRYPSRRFGDCGK